jgi:single-stranded-DNA-specific exonuclease
VLAARELAPLLEIDCNLPLRQVRGDEIRWLSRLGPFGIGNPQPLFLARGVMVSDARVVGNGDKHLKLRLRDDGLTWPAIAFDMGDFDAKTGDRVDVVYTVEATGYDGALEIHVEDMRLAEAPAPA